jgi:glycosyltransferase involved in cell wall biosynthesis
MKVTLSVFGRFHAFNLAHQLSRRGHLNRLITSYPAFEAEKYGVPKGKIRSLPHYEALKRGWGRLEKWLPSEEGSSLINRGFEWGASRHIPEDTDIFVGWSGTAERGLSRARAMGAKAVLERGSGHIEHQCDLLQVEAERVGVSVNLPTPKVIEKEKREYEQAEYIVIPSYFAERSFQKYGIDSSKLIRIAYGVDLGEFPQEEKADDTFRIVYAGRMSLQKGVHYLLEAFSELSLPDSELLLLGSKRPEIAPFFEKYEGEFRYLGHKPQDQLYRYYSQGSVFVLNSIQDGFGMVIPQAMACGLPAICTEHTGGPDIVRDGTDGFIIPIQDTGKLKEKLHWCYENREACRAMGEAARERVEKKFKWKNYGNRVVDKYEKVLK